MNTEPNPSEKKPQKRTIENREKLLATSIKQFSTLGYHNTNIRSITKEAGLSTGIFYRYFENKESLYLTLVEEYFVQSTQMLQEMLNMVQLASNKDEARMMIKDTLAPAMSRSTENVIFVSDIDIVEKELPALREVVKKGNYLLTNCLEQGLRKQYPSSDMNYSIMARLIYASTDAIGRDISKESDLCIKSEYIDLFIEQILYYLFDLDIPLNKPKS